MKALSVRPEYTFDIFLGEQTFEERTWQTDYRGDLLVCASSRKTPGFVSGYAYFVVPLLDIELSDNEVMNGSGNIVHPYHWKLGKPKAIQPIPVKGKLHLFDVDDALIHYVAEGDLGAYKTSEEADMFRDAFCMTFLDPLIFSKNATTMPSLPDPNKPLLRQGTAIPSIAPKDDLLLEEAVDAMLYLPQNPPITEHYNALREDLCADRLGVKSLKQYTFNWFFDKYVQTLQKLDGRQPKAGKETGTYSYYMRFLSLYGLLWMAEALGESPEKLKEAMNEALAAGKEYIDDACNAFRRIIPFKRICQLYDNPSGWLIDADLNGLITINKQDGYPDIIENKQDEFDQALHAQGIYLN